MAGMNEPCFVYIKGNGPPVGRSPCVDSAPDRLSLSTEMLSQARNCSEKTPSQTGRLLTGRRTLRGEGFMMRGSGGGTRTTSQLQDLETRRRSDPLPPPPFRRFLHLGSHLTAASVLCPLPTRPRDIGIGVEMRKREGGAKDLRAGIRTENVMILPLCLFRSLLIDVTPQFCTAFLCRRPHKLRRFSKSNPALLGFCCALFLVRPFLRCLAVLLLIH